MTPDNSDLLSLHISTEAFPAGDALEAFREIFGKAILRIEMDPLDGHELQADMMLRALPGFGIGTGWTSPARNAHTSNLVDSDDLVLVAIHQGHSEFERHGRKLAVNAGDVVVTTIGEAATFTAPVKTHVTNLRFSREMLAPHLGNVGKALSQPILRKSPALDLLLGYANVVRDNDALATPELRRAIVTHMHDLAAIAIGATRDTEEIANGRGVRAARLRAVKTVILENLGNPNLTIGEIAFRNGVTPRYINMLFEIEGISFSEFVLAQRLELARRMLTHSRDASRTISSIAFEVGFSDLSYFNRSFRRRFGMTPSDMRAKG